ncbi:MAG: Imm70 family immunity protein [Phycisphaerales bacterium]
MGLCLYVFSATESDDDDAEELAECDVGRYADFGCFRATIAAKLDGKRYPVLMMYPDCDGEWSTSEVAALERELLDISDRFQKLPPEEPKGAFEHTAEFREDAESLYDCFHDVNGENLFESMLALCEAAKEHDRPITFM